MPGNSLDRVLPDALARAQNLPTLPAVALEILALARDDETELSDYVALLERDPALAARILRVANSPQFSMGQPVSTLDRATLVLGTKAVQLMALSFSLMNHLCGGGTRPSFDREGFWRRSLASAVGARELSRILGLHMNEEAFLCGLLSHVGQLVLAECLAEEYAAVLEQADAWPDGAQERALLGFDGAAVGGALLDSWGLPAAIHRAVAHHPRLAELPRDTPAGVRELTGVVALAVSMAHALFGRERGAALAEVHDLARRRGLTLQQAETVILALEHRVAEMAELLDLDLAPSRPHHELLDEARSRMLEIGLAARADLAAERRRGSHLRARRAPSPAELDEVTGLGDGGYLDSVLAQELARRAGGDAGEPLGLLLLEVSGARARGAAADELLQEVGAALRTAARQGDVPARLATWRFAVLVPSCGASGLDQLAGRLHAALDEVAAEGGPPRGAVTLGGALLRSTDADDARARLMAAAVRSLEQSRVGSIPAFPAV